MLKKLVLCSDTHELHRSLSWPEGDILVHAGDFTMNGRPEKIEEFGKWLHYSPFSAIIIIAGNHDILFQKKPEKAKKLLSKHDKIHYPEDSGCRVDGISFYGAAWQPESGYGWASTLDTEQESRKKWQSIPPGVQVLITHGTAGWNTGFYGRWKACRQYVTTGRDQSKNKAATTSLWPHT